jgi:hypothetical protein
MRLLAGLLLVVLAACGSAAASPDAAPPVGSTSKPTTTTTTTAPPTTTTTLPPTTTTTAPPPAGHTVADGSTLPLAQAGAIVVVHPSARVERVGFHQSTLVGAQELTVLPTAISPTTLNTRNRGTGDRTAADVVVEPGSAVVAPVSGTVLKAGAYRLYCAYDDETVVIAPDGHPEGIVTVLHLQGVTVAAGQHVVAGTTQIAANAHQLPFRSQVDRLSKTKPAWPHVHVEIDDPSVADTPSKGDSC